MPSTSQAARPARVRGRRHGTALATVVVLAGTLLAVPVRGPDDVRDAGSVGPAVSGTTAFDTAGLDTPGLGRTGPAVPAVARGGDAPLPPATAGCLPLPLPLPAPLPRVTVVGDSYTDVAPYADPAGEGWAHLLADRLGWDLVVRAVGSSGYVNPGLAGRPWPELADAVVGDDPDLVLLVGSRNDLPWTPDDLLAAARRLHAALDRLPADVPVVVVGPVWDASAPVPEVLGLRDALARSAAEHAMPFVDPLEGGGWFAGRAELVIPQDVHLTPQGQEELAEHLEAALRERGVVPRVRLDAPRGPRDC